WSVVDHSLFNDFEFFIRPAINMPLLESVLMENQNNGSITRTVSNFFFVGLIIKNLDLKKRSKRWLNFQILLNFLLQPLNN
ncbi:hypothetical protein RhiirB3_417363, partial [Rhizophagus irregularis]